MESHNIENSITVICLMIALLGMARCTYKQTEYKEQTKRIKIKHNCKKVNK